MPISNKLKFINQEKTTQHTTVSTSWTLQGTMLDANRMSAGHDYVMVAWVNCTSPGSNDGATKFAFEGGAGDIVGSVQQRHDTNSSGMYIAHMGQFTAPNPPQNIGVYRKVIYDAGETESTDYGQCFAIDLSYSGASGGLLSGTDFASSIDTSVRIVSAGDTIHSFAVPTNGPHLILAACKALDSSNTVLLSTTIDGTIVASGSRFVQDSFDIKTVPFAVTTDANTPTVTIKNSDADTVTASYSYIFALNLDNSSTTKATGQLLTWTDHTASGSWGTKTIDGNNDTSFVIGMGRQTATGVESGRMAAISLKNNTSGEYLIFKDRPSGDYSPLYYPATNPGVNVGQHELSIIVGVGTIGEADEIEMTTL